MHVAKTKVLISFAVTAKLICAFVFALALCWFYAVAHLVDASWMATLLGKSRMTRSSCMLKQFL